MHLFRCIIRARCKGNQSALGGKMTRNTKDDLLISYQLFNEYITFLNNRLDLQLEEIEKKLMPFKEK